jgi:hypothetical protein
MSIQNNKIFHLPKFTQITIFGLKINHLATLADSLVRNDSTIVLQFASSFLTTPQLPKMCGEKTFEK